MDTIAEIDDAPQEGDLLMLKKKSEKLSRVFTEILSRPSTTSQKKRQQQEQLAENESVVSKAEKRKTKESIKKRGHEKVPRLGEDPEHDRLEKKFLRLATKGVVQMFNTASKFNKREKIKRNEAVPKQKPTVNADHDQSQDLSKSTDPWTVLQDSYLDEAVVDSESEDWEQASNSVDLDGSIELDELSD